MPNYYVSNEDTSLRIFRSDLLESLSHVSWFVPHLIYLPVVAIYDTIHYAVHHFGVRSRVMLYLKKLHFQHHYGDPKADFGISSPLWDFVFRTASPATRGDAEVVQ